jgi:site-specific DNA-methyltransferase (adenine-specific)
MKLVHSTDLGKLFEGDCLELLASMESDSVDTVFADPPFNLGKDYGKKINDSMVEAEYLEWCLAWVKECVRVVKPGGAFFLWNLPKWNIHLGHFLSEQGMTFRHWVAVDIKYSLPIPGRLYPSHYSLLYYTKGKPTTFSRPRVPIPTCRHCGGDIKDYGGHRNKLNPLGLNLTDVWFDIFPVRHRSTKTRSANQLHEKVLQRVLEISTVEGDLVFDPFGGSGTTFAVAEEMRRRWLGSELGDCSGIIERLKGETKPIIKNAGDAGKGLRKGK